MYSSQVEVVLIGLGKASWLYAEENSNLKFITHTHSLVENSNFRIIAGCDKNQKLSKSWEMKFGIKAYDNVLALPRHADLVVIAVDHANLCGTLLEALIKWPSSKFLIEKPLVSNTEDLVALESLTPAQIEQVYINFPRLFQPETHQLKSILDNYINNREGEVLKVSGFYSGGFLNTASHFLSLQKFLFGDIQITLNPENLSRGVSYTLESKNFSGSMIGIEQGASTGSFTVTGNGLKISYLEGGSKIYVGGGNNEPFEIDSTRDFYQLQVYSSLAQSWTAHSVRIASLKSQMGILDDMIRIHNEWKQLHVSN